ncbi:MAG TPA: PASTA domain-containing protein [Candidatus Kapabacteria bacterium]|nr:PASTA domain-containing protein [Candidatus Kapabacteria bacterium]HOV92184.1 PASTA domain-containing protein [Candidatus Kapabacteria bacterium]
MEFKKLLPYLEVLAAFLGAVLIIFLIFDNWILPSVVKDRKIVKVPNVVGMPSSTAINLLNENGLEYAIVSQQNNETYPKDYVIKQVPAPGTEVKESRQVLLTLSKGKENTSAPNVIGQYESYARSMISNAELNVGNISYQKNDSIPKGIVISQNPPPNSTVSLNGYIDLVISEGAEEKVIIPDLTGKSLNDAENILSDIGLKVGDVSYIRSETFLPNTIVRQSPLPGENVVKGAAVNLVISH